MFCGLCVQACYFLGIFFVCLLKVLFSPVLRFILHQNNFSFGTEFQTIHKKMLILKITDSDRKTDYHWTLLLKISSLLFYTSDHTLFQTNLFLHNWTNVTNYFSNNFTERTVTRFTNKTPLWLRTLPEEDTLLKPEYPRQTKWSLICWNETKKGEDFQWCI